MKVCKKCNEINGNDTLFCCNCGGEDFVFQEEVVCKACGKANDISFAYCMHCGHSLVEQTPVRSSAVVNGKEVANVRSELNEVYGGVDNEFVECPSCGQKLPLTAMFCHNCGESIANLHIHKVVNRKICPHCGRPNDKQEAYCTYCFSSLADAKIEQLQVVHEVVNLGEIVVKQTMLDDGLGKKKVCPNCNTLNTVQQQFCVSCGLKLTVDPPKKYCPVCSTENQGDSSFCIKCNWSFDGTTPQGKPWVCDNCKNYNDQDSTYCSSCGKKRI